MGVYSHHCRKLSSLGNGDTRTSGTVWCKHKDDFSAWSSGWRAGVRKGLPGEKSWAVVLGSSPHLQILKSFWFSYFALYFLMIKFLLDIGWKNARSWNTNEALGRWVKMLAGCFQKICGLDLSVVSVQGPQASSWPCFPLGPHITCRTESQYPR